MLNNATDFPTDVLKNAYEELRSNVLGKTNCCRGLVVFLRYGMAAWMRMLQTQPTSKTEETRKAIKNPAGFPEEDVFASRLAAVIADGIIAAQGFAGGIEAGQ